MSLVNYVSGLRSGGAFQSFYDSPIKLTSGQQIFPCIVYFNTNFPKNGYVPRNNSWYFGIAYKADSIKSNLQSIGLPITGNKYVSKWQQIQTGVYTYTCNAYENTPSAYCFNATKKVGFFGFSPDASSWVGYPTTIEMENTTYSALVGSVPILTYSDTEDFWNKLLSASDFYIPWKDDTSKKGGGYGKWDDNQSDAIGLPDLSALNAQSFGKTNFITTYRMTFGEINSLSAEFWKPSFIQGLKQIFENPMESIIGLTMLPCDSVGTAKNVIIGGYDTSVTSHVIGNQFINISCGSIEIPEKWAGALDYHSGVSLYLPFIGIQPLDIQEVMGSSVSVNYYVDVVTGSCIAFVKVKKGNLDSVLYHFTGNCGYSLPLSKNDFTAVFNTLVGATATAVGAVATGGASAGIMASVAIGSSMLSNAKEHTQHSGSMGGNTGIMGIKKPYLIIYRPIQSFPNEFGSFRGFPSNITETLSSLKGFTKVKEIHLENIGATDAEKAEIEQLLKSGVIIK